jgi:hypothetical protein
MQINSILADWVTVPPVKALGSRVVERLNLLAGRVARVTLITAIL